MLGFGLATLFLAGSLFLRNAKNDLRIAKQEEIRKEQEKIRKEIEVPYIYFRETVDKIFTKELPEDLKEERKKWLAWKNQQEQKKSFLSKIMSCEFRAEQEPPCKVKKLSDYYDLEVNNYYYQSQLNHKNKTDYYQYSLKIDKCNTVMNGTSFHLDSIDSCIQVGSGPGITKLSEKELKGLISLITVKSPLFKNNKFVRWLFGYPDILELFLKRREESLDCQEARRCINEPWPFKVTFGDNKSNLIEILMEQDLVGFAVLGSLCFKPHDKQENKIDGECDLDKHGIGMDPKKQKKIIELLLKYGADVNRTFRRPYVVGNPYNTKRETRKRLDLLQGFLIRDNIKNNGYDDDIKFNKIYNLVFNNHTLSLQPPMSLPEWYLYANPEGPDKTIWDTLVQETSDKGLCERLKPFALLSELGNTAYEILDKACKRSVFKLLTEKIEKEPPCVWYKDLKEGKMSVPKVYEKINNILDDKNLQKNLLTVTKEQENNVKAFNDQCDTIRKLLKQKKEEHKQWLMMLKDGNKTIDFTVSYK
jgi:hypothetical protein